MTNATTRKRPWLETRKPRTATAALPPYIATLKFDNETRVVTNMQREPIQPGTYGRVEVLDSGWIDRAVADIINPHLGMTASELREAAHLFNQLAEALEQTP